jgi:hypothetical protein
MLDTCVQSEESQVDVPNLAKRVAYNAWWKNVAAI